MSLPPGIVALLLAVSTGLESFAVPIERPGGHRFELEPRGDGEAGVECTLWREDALVWRVLLERPLAQASASPLGEVWGHRYAEDGAWGTLEVVRVTAAGETVVDRIERVSGRGPCSDPSPTVRDQTVLHDGELLLRLSGRELWSVWHVYRGDAPPRVLRPDERFGEYFVELAGVPGAPGAILARNNRGWSPVRSRFCVLWLDGTIAWLPGEGDHDSRAWTQPGARIVVARGRERVTYAVEGVGRVVEVAAARPR